MKVLVVWIIISVANSSGVRTQSGELKFPTRDDCEKARMSEMQMVSKMVKTIGSHKTNQDLDTQYLSKCEQVNVVVSQ